MSDERFTDLLTRFKRLIPTLSNDVLESVLAEVPLYRNLPAEQLQGEVLHVVRVNLEAFLRSLPDGRPRAEDLAFLRSSAARRAEEGVPLDSVLAAYSVGARTAWRALVQLGEREEPTALLELATAILRYTETVVGAVTSTYVEAHEELQHGERETRRALIRALLSGESPTELFASLGMVSAATYSLVAFQLLRPAAEPQGLSTLVATRRRARRIEALLVDRFGPDLLVGIDGDEGVILTSETCLAALGSLRDFSRSVHAALVSGSEGPVRLVVAPPVPERELPARRQELRRLLDVASRLERPAVPLLRDDLTLEIVAADSADRLASVLSPLDDHPELRSTLETWLAADRNRTLTARRLHIHPNTLDYRLGRVRDLTGLELTSTCGLALVVLSVLAKRLHERRV